MADRVDAVGSLVALSMAEGSFGASAIQAARRNSISWTWPELLETTCQMTMHSIWPPTLQTRDSLEKPGGRLAGKSFKQQSGQPALHMTVTML